MRLALDSDAAVRELIGGRSGVVYRDNSDIYGVDVADEETLQEVHGPRDSTRRGVLARAVQRRHAAPRPVAPTDLSRLVGAPRTAL